MKLALEASDYRKLRGNLEVRLQSDAPTLVSQHDMASGQCMLTLDLPTKHWKPGLYEARTQITREDGEVLWESSWEHAFSLRPLPWAG